MPLTFLRTALFLTAAWSLAAQPPVPPPQKGPEQVGRPDSSGESIDAGGARLSTTSVGQFLETVTKSNERTITEAVKALSRTTNNDVKSYAQMVIEDRQAMSKDLEKLAAEKKTATQVKALVTPAGTEPTEKGGDPEFLEKQATNAQREAKSFAEAATEHQDPEVRSLAAKHLTAIRKQEKEARRILILVSRPSA